MDTTSLHWIAVCGGEKGELTTAQRDKAERMRRWQSRRDAISRDVIDGTIETQEEEATRLRDLGPMPCKLKIGGFPTRERYYFGKTCFTFDHNVSRGFNFWVEEVE